MKLGELKGVAVKLIDEYSNDPNITSDEDIRLKLNDLFNLAQFEICQLKKIKRSISIIQNIPTNSISPQNNPDEFYTHNASDIVFTGSGNCYYFQINGKATITIAQSGMQDIVINTENEGNFKTYKGVTSGKGTITLTFGGNTFYTIKNVAVFEARYESETDIPNYERYLTYDLPADFYQMNYLENKGSESRDYVVKEKKLRVSSYCVGEIVVNYYAYPSVITAETDDEYEFELDLEAQMLLPYYVASDILKSDVSANYTSFEAKYNAKLEILNSTTDTSGIEIIQIIGNL